MKPLARDLLLLFLLSCAAVLLHGYRYGTGDHFHYLPAWRHALDPSLYPHDAEFFLPYTRWSLFDDLLIASLRLFRLPLDWGVFLWHLGSLFLLLLGCRRVAWRVFPGEAARWAAVVFVAALLLVVAGGTLVSLAESYLVPRTLATASLLFAVPPALDRRPQALVWVALAFLIHPTMALAGSFHLVFLAWPARNRAVVAPAAAMLGLIAPVDVAWREALQTRYFLWPQRWPPVVWLGVVAPLLALWWFGRLARRQGNAILEHFSRRLLASGSVGLALATLVTMTPGLERAAAAEPFRISHLLYLLTLLLGAGLAGQRLLRNHPLRWALLLVPLCAGIFFGHRMLHPASPHIEWPGRVAENDYAQAFEWVRQNTPRDALFALDPRYTERPGNDDHSFRGLAARSRLADFSNDRMSAAVWPELAPVWYDQVKALEGWAGFGLEDFQRLKRERGVSWVVLEQPGVYGLACPYENATVRVCRIP